MRSKITHVTVIR